MQVSYQRDLEHNYMVLETSKEVQGSEYQVRMLMQNDLPGLLKCELRMVDGSPHFYYEITSKQPLSRLFHSKQITYKDLYQILTGLEKAFLEVSRYLLDENCLLLNEEYIYMDVETKESFFCYLPFHEGETRVSFREFAEYLLKKLDHEDTKAVVWGYRIYSGTIQENYSVTAVLQKIHQSIDREEKRRADGYEMNQQQQTVMDQDTMPPKVIQEQNIELKYKKESKIKKEPKIKKESRINKEPKKKIESGSDKDSKKKIESMINTGFIKKKCGTVSKRTWIVLLIHSGCMISLLLLLCFGIISITQGGGSMFLLFGVTIYFLTGTEKKNNEIPFKKKKNLDAEVFDFTYKETEAKERKRKNNEETKWGNQKQKKDFFAVRAGEMKKESQVCTISEISQEEEEICVFMEEEPYGHTTVLCRGAQSEFPMLMSMNLAEREHIILSKERITIGKLKGQADILLNSPSISRIHASIEQKGQVFFLKDLNSTNGTFLNGQALNANESREIQNGDEIYFADAGYYFTE